MSDRIKKRPKDFEQVCVWPGTIVGGDKIKKFEKFIADEFNGTRAKYLEEIKTAPDRDRDGFHVSETGGRNDVIFAIHIADVPKFAAARLAYGIRWLEDVLDNERRASPDYSIYPPHLKEYCA